MSCSSCFVPVVYKGRNKRVDDAIHPAANSSTIMTSYTLRYKAIARKTTGHLAVFYKGTYPVSRFGQLKEPRCVSVFCFCFTMTSNRLHTPSFSSCKLSCLGDLNGKCVCVWEGGGIWGWIAWIILMFVSVLLGLFYKKNRNIQLGPGK